MRGGRFIRDLRCAGAFLLPQSSRAARFSRQWRALISRAWNRSCSFFPGSYMEGPIRILICFHLQSRLLPLAIFNGVVATLRWRIGGEPREEGRLQEAVFFPTSGRSGHPTAASICYATTKAIAVLRPQHSLRHMLPGGRNSVVMRVNPLQQLNGVVILITATTFPHW
ncbi:unnamed protein product [Urochloa humidicola]